MPIDSVRSRFGRAEPVRANGDRSFHGKKVLASRTNLFKRLNPSLAKLVRHPHAFLALRKIATKIRKQVDRCAEFAVTFESLAKPIHADSIRRPM